LKGEKLSKIKAFSDCPMTAIAKVPTAIAKVPTAIAKVPTAIAFFRDKNMHGLSRMLHVSQISQIFWIFEE